MPERKADCNNLVIANIGNEALVDRTVAESLTGGKFRQYRLDLGLERSRARQAFFKGRSGHTKPYVRRYDLPEDLKRGVVFRLTK
jgi:hypothetical protein